MKLLSLNIKGGSQMEKLVNVIAFGKQSRADLLFLCESHITNSQLPELKKRWPAFGWFTNCLDSNSCGVTMVILTPARIPIDTAKVTYQDEEGRVLKMRMLVEGGKPVRITGIYAPNTETGNVSFFRKLAGLEKQGKSDIIVGDFNRCEAPIDRNPSRPEDCRVRNALIELRGTRFIDGWREVNSEERQYTYWSNNNMCSASRLDRILVSKKVMKRSLKWEIVQTPPFTDHAAVSVEYFPHDQVETGKGQWYLNVNMLGKPKMDEPINEVICDHKVTLSFIQRELVQATGTERRDLAQLYIDEVDRMLDGFGKTAQRVQEEQALMYNQIQIKLERKIRKIDTEERTRKNTRLLRKWKAQLDALNITKQKNRVIQTRLKWLEINGENGADFWKLGKTYTEDRSVHALMDKEGKIKKKSHQVLDVATDFYKELYTRRVTYKEDQDTLLEHISTEDFTDAAGPLTEKELEKVLKNLANGSSPGPDGLPHEFFKHFTRSAEGRAFEKILLETFSILIQPHKYGVQIPKKWARSTIKISHKKGERCDIKNYRPLSMTNTVYKMLTGLVNNRLLPIFNKHIGQHQVGFMPQRTYFDHVKHVQALIDHARLHNRKLFIALLDQEKAYDRVDHTFLWRLLEKFGVPKQIRMTIEGIYSQSTTTVSVNKFTSDPFQIGSGVRQGDPLSCLLYNVLIETLALEIKSAEPKLGYQDDTGRWHSCDMYADDTAFFLTELSQWKEYRRRYDIFKRASGHALNERKTKIIIAHDDDLAPTEYQGIGISREEIYLGIPIGSKVDYPAFWNRVHEKVKLTLKPWSDKHLSYRQRVAVSVTALESRLWYFLRTVPANKKDLDPIERTILYYVWGIDPSKKLMGPIKISHAYRPIDMGGLGLLKIGTMWKSLGLYWIGRLKTAELLTPPERPLWYPLIVSMMTFHADERIRSMILRPWEQKWTSTRSRMPLSISQFLRHWDVTATTPPITHLGVLSGLNFWFHPQLNQNRAHQRWAAPVWRELFFGSSELAPVQTISDLWEIEQGRVDATQNQKRAVSRLLSTLPEDWKKLLENVTSRLPGMLSEPLPLAMYINKAGHMLELGPKTTNKGIYIVLNHDNHGDEDLLAYFRLVSTRDGVQWDKTPPEQIWKSIRQRKVDYPKFTDLYWKLMLGKVRTGEEWMDSRECPQCGVLQTQEHLMWTCPIAVRIWQEVQHLWTNMTDDDLLFPDTWSDMLLTGCTHSSGAYKKATPKRRWRILFSEALWSLWTHRCAWSFGEIQEFEGNGVLNRFRQRIETRLQMDRYTAKDGKKSIKKEVLRDTWGPFF